jgi:hypothetical protein
MSNCFYLSFRRRCCYNVVNTNMTFIQHIWSMLLLVRVHLLDSRQLYGICYKLINAR